MSTLTVYPENDEQLTAMKAVMAALKVAFVENEEEEDAALPDVVINDVKETLAEIESGEGLLPFTSARDMLNQP